jgi:hypothetical protein
MAGFFNPCIDLTNKHKCEEHIKSVAQMMEKALSPFGIKVKPPIQADTRAVSIFGDGHIDGMIYSNHVECFSEIIIILVSSYFPGMSPPPGHGWGKTKIWVYTAYHACLASLTQTGKTSLLNLLAALSAVIYLLTGQATLLIRLLINDCSLEAQANEEAENFINLYGDLQFCYGDKSITIKSYMEYTKQVVTELVDVTTTPIGCVMRTSSSMKGDIAHLFSACQKNNFLPIIAADESHARSDKNGMMDRMLEQCVGEEHKHWLEQKISFFGLSATNFALGRALVKLGYEPPIFLKPGDNYTGYPWEPVTRKKVKVEFIPEVVTIAEISALANSRLAAYRADFVGSPEKYAENTGGNDHAAYRTKFCREFAKVLLWLTRNNPKNGRGIIVRICNSNDMTNSVIEEMRPMLKEVDILPPYNTDGAGRDRDRKVPSLKKHIKRHSKPNRFYLVVVTGRGRMGTAAPVDLRYGIDFTNESEFQTLIQGVPGRLTGYGKGQTMVILSEKNAGMLKNFIKTGEIRNHKGKLVSPYKKHVGGQYDENLKVLTLHRRDVPAEFMNKIDDVMCIHNILVCEKDKRALSRRTGYEGRVLAWNMIDGDYLKEIEKSQKCRVLRPGTRTVEGEYMDCDTKGQVAYAARYMDNRARRNSNVRSWSSRHHGDTGPQGQFYDVRPTILLDEDLQVVEIKLRTHPYKKVEQRVKPTSAYHVPVAEL